MTVLWTVTYSWYEWYSGWSAKDQRTDGIRKSSKRDGNQRKFYLGECPKYCHGTPPPGGGGHESWPCLGPKFAPKSFFTSPNTPEHFQNVLKRFSDVSGHLNYIFIIFWKIMIFCVFSLYTTTQGLHRNYTGIGYRPIQIPFSDKYSSPLVLNHHCSIKKRLYSLEPH